jgi:hypothetical protein
MTSESGPAVTTFEVDGREVRRTIPIPSVADEAPADTARRLQGYYAARSVAAAAAD